MNYGLLLLLIFFAFLLLRVFSSNESSIAINIVVPRNRASSLGKDVNKKLDFDCSEWSSEWSKVYNKLVIMDQNFTWHNFSKVISVFHDKVLTGFAAGKKEHLTGYASGNLLDDLSTRINEYQEKDLKQHTDIVASKIDRIENIKIEGKSKAIFDVKILDKLISFITDKDDNIVQGSKNIISYDWIWTIVGDIVDGSFKWHVVNISKPTKL